MKEIRLKKRIEYDGYMSIDLTKNNEYELQLRNSESDYFCMTLTFDELVLVKDYIIAVLQQPIERKNEKIR